MGGFYQRSHYFRASAVLVLVIALINGSNPIGFSKMHCSGRKHLKQYLKCRELAWAGGDTYYNYDKGNLKKIRQNGSYLGYCIKGQTSLDGARGISLF